MKNKIIIVSLLVAIITVIGISIAYFTNSIDIENLFETKPYGTKVDEDFESPDNWLPGTTTPKTLTVTNTGEVDEAVRISFTETWTSKNAKNNDEEGDLALQQGDNKVALINFINPDDWTKVVENNKTYYYYNYKLGPNQTTSELLDSVTFNSAITNDYSCVESDTDSSKTMKCKSTGNGYDGATYKLTFNIETIQYDKYKIAWGTSVDIVEARPEPEPEPEKEGVKGVEYLLENALNQSNTTYSDQTKNKMFVFNHAATSQTPALTDYRYIGDNPNNYVYFNCEDYNNAETCEIWRIIGVFDVEDENGINEQRIKIVRNFFDETMPWDYRRSETWNDVTYYYDGKNDWNESYINNYLNGSYLNSLDVVSQTMIGSTKYYLGEVDGLGYEYTPVLSGENLYFQERSNSVPNENPINGVSKISLPYISDFFYIYANGVDDKCYNDVLDCKSWEYTYQFVALNNPGYPDKGWMYTIDGKYLVAFLNPSKIIENSIISLDYLYYYKNKKYFNAYYKNGYNTESPFYIRPVLYLKSSIKIIDGTGEESNPYKLSI